MMARTSSSASGSSSWSTFIKSIFIPLFSAALLYTAVFVVILPLYRRYKSQIARYSAYAPLDSELARRTTGLFSPYIIEPGATLVQKIKQKIRITLWRWLVPGLRDVDLDGDGDRGGRREGGRGWGGTGEEDEEEMVGSGEAGCGDHAGRDGDDHDEEGGLFDAETGQSMVGFDVREATGDGRGFSLGRVRVQNQLSRDERARRFARELAGQIEPAEVDSQRRLSRDLERAFGDDSDEEEDAGVVVGRNG